MGLKAQRDNIVTFAKAEGYDVVGEYVEIETGKGADALDRRPKLVEALAAARIRTTPIRGNGAAVFTLARIRANISPKPPRPSRPAQLVADFTCR